MNVSILAPNSRLSVLAARAEKGPVIADESLFNQLLALERKRTERTADPFVLMILDIAPLNGSAPEQRVTEICTAIREETRDTDLFGWYQRPSALGAIFTALRDAQRPAIESALDAKTRRALSKVLPEPHRDKVQISFHFFPEDTGQAKPDFKSDRKLYRDLDRKERSQALYHILKRTIDVVGSLSALILLSPVVLAIAYLI